MNSKIEARHHYFPPGPRSPLQRWFIPGNHQDAPWKGDSSASFNSATDPNDDHNDFFNYALLIVLYTLQGIPMGLSASIPFLIQQKMKTLAAAAAAAAAGSAATASTAASAVVGSAAASYNANALFALCSWPFSLKLLWAPIVDAIFFRRFGRRKSWLVPVQSLAGILMVMGSSFVERQLGLGPNVSLESAINVKGVTAFFFALYFLMATQDIAVDGWALTMLAKKNRGRGPVCNSIGQNLGYFLSFVGFLALNDPESSEIVWRPLLGLPSNPSVGIVSLGGFLRIMGYLMILTTTAVAFFKQEAPASVTVMPDKPDASLMRAVFPNKQNGDTDSINKDDDDDKELDASEIGLAETYHRLWAVCQLPAVRWLFVILLTYRLPTALGDNVKFLKAVEYGLSRSTTALLSPTVILPLGILVPIIASKIWHGQPLCGQFMTGYKLRVTLAPLLDILLLTTLQRGKPTTTNESIYFWSILVLSTAVQAIVSSLQFNAQMTFFAHRVDPAIGGSYMTLLNTAANLGGTWPASFVMWMVGHLTKGPVCSPGTNDTPVCTTGRDPYLILQLLFSALGCLWIFVMGGHVQRVANLPDDAWRTHLLDKDPVDEENPMLFRLTEFVNSTTSGMWRPGKNATKGE